MGLELNNMDYVVTTKIYENKLNDIINNKLSIYSISIISYKIN